MNTKLQSRAYRQLWRIVDGAVADALKHHEDYLTDKGKRSARRSITKRVTGAILGYAEQSARGRSGASPAANSGHGAAATSRPGDVRLGMFQRLWRLIRQSRSLSRGRAA